MSVIQPSAALVDLVGVFEPLDVFRLVLVLGVPAGSLCRQKDSMKMSRPGRSGLQETSFSWGG
jgi:hypothetical protein